MKSVLIFTALAALSSIACDGRVAPSGSPSSTPPSKGVSSVETYFPLEDGRLYQYATLEGGETGMLVAKVHRVDATHGELRLSNATKRFVYTEGGVAYDGGAIILKAPLDVGASWPGEHGGVTRIVSTSTSMTVPAGTYAGCIQTAEEGGRGAKYTTTYCPGVGMVLLEVSTSSGEARAALKSYGLPAKID